MSLSDHALEIAVSAITQATRAATPEAEANGRDRLKDIVAQAFVCRDEFLLLTRDAVGKANLPGCDLDQVCQASFDQYIISQFYDRVIASVDSGAARRQADYLIDFEAVKAFGIGSGPALLVTLHHGRYLPLGIGLYDQFSNAHELKARPDIMEAYGQADVVKHRTLYTNEPTSALRAIAKLREGCFFYMLIDHVHPNGQMVAVDLLGTRINVNLGAAWIAWTAKVPIITAMLVGGPDGRQHLTPSARVDPSADLAAVMQQVYASLESFVAAAPGMWSRWFTAFDDRRELDFRPRMRAANNNIWKQLASRFFEQKAILDAKR